MLFHLPTSLLDRSFSCPLSSAPEGVIATFVVTVEEHVPPPVGRRGRRPYRIVCSNDTGTITLIFYHSDTRYLQQSLPVGTRRVISGHTERFDYKLQMTHPDVIAPPEKLSEVQQIEPVYPLTLGLTNRRVAKIIHQALDATPELPEWIAAQQIQSRQWPSWRNALESVHHPRTAEDLGMQNPARMRLAYDEILAQQLQLALLRRNTQQQAGKRIRSNSALRGKLIADLPFTLTQGQLSVYADISTDMASGRRMIRLLQGDVGSGKTVVALLAMLDACEAGFQSAMMVPTEMIAQQHFRTLSNLTAQLGVNIVLLTGSVKGKARQETLAAIRNGSAQIIIGTQALFQEHVEFHQLALTVIDEQHRFGVAQRMALLGKGINPHVLHMTATPIPRSLTMLLYGDMDCSILREKPAERRPITTRTVPLSRYGEVVERLETALQRGEKAYWICPLIENKSEQEELALSQEQDIAAAELRHTEFSTRFGDAAGMVHGRMPPAERERHMKEFTTGKVKLLVATTVVEVGVDVRDATIIVIERAERFGLSQLHQLRGRVGRGGKPSFCVLLYSDQCGEISKARLSTLRDTEDGFAIAEADLMIRGGGDVLGSRQSGLPRFIFTDIEEHNTLIAQAHEEVMQILENDPQLKSDRGKALSNLLQLFYGAT